MFVECFVLSFSENEYNKPGKLTTMGLYILAALWRKFPANSVKEKGGHTMICCNLKCRAYFMKHRCKIFQCDSSLHYLFYCHGWDGYRTPPSSHAWEMPIWGDKSSNHSIGLMVFKSAYKVNVEDIMEVMLIMPGFSIYSVNEQSSDEN